MNTNSRNEYHQQKRLKQHCAKDGGFRFFELLTSETLIQKTEGLMPDHRNRLFSPTETLSMFLTQALSADRSCQNVVNNAAVQRVRSGSTLCSTHTGAYCKARQRLPLEMISGLARFVGNSVSSKTPKKWLWKGRRVKIADGTTVTMPDTPMNQQVFPQPKSQKPGIGFPIARLVGTTCLSTGTLQHAQISPTKGKGSDEQTLLRSMQDQFEVGDIVLGYAYLSTFIFIAQMQAQGVDILMEQYGARKRTTDFKTGKSLGPRDHIISIKKPKKKPDWMDKECYESLPDSLSVRELKIGGKVLVTTMCCPKNVSRHELKGLYKQRWSIEVNLRDIKTTMGMDKLSCKTPDMVIKEIWVHILAYNLIRLIMAQAAWVNGSISPREISFKHSLQLWLTWSQHGTSNEANMLQELFKLAGQQRVGNRSGRVEPRAVKRRPKPYPLLNKPREEAREDIRKNGHPKKLK